MADSEGLQKLKDIPFKIQSANLRERREVIEEIRNVLSTPEGITEAHIRYVCRVLMLTLNRYRDSTSQSYVRSLLMYLATSHREYTLKSMLPLLLEISEQLRNSTISKSICLSGLYALGWSAVVVEAGLKDTEEDGVDYNTLVLAQGKLLAVVTAYGNKKRNHNAYCLLHSSWRAIGKEKLKKWIRVLLDQPADAGPHVCLTFSALCRHAKQIGDEDLVAEHKAKMLESLIKTMITVKTRPNANYIQGCADLLHTLKKSDVQETLLPSLHKAMLRSPETIIQAVGEVISNLGIYVDGLAVDVGKSFIVNTHSRDEWVRVEAVRALGNLARRVNDPATAKTLLSHAFAEYNGASGKLTSSEEKIAVLNGVSILHELAVPDSEQPKLFQEAITQLSRILDSESHERTICVALDVIHRWTLIISGQLPEQVLQLFKKNISAKNTTQSVRIAYVSLVARALRRTSAAPAHADALRPALAAAVDRALQQPLQPLVVSEGVSAMLALTLLDARRELPGRAAWAALAHPDKHVLLHDRLLAAATDDVLIQVVMLCRNVLEKYPSVAKETGSPAYRALILTLLSPINNVRKIAIEEVKLLLAEPNRALVSRNLVLKLNEVLEEGKIFTTKEKSPSEEKGVSSEVTGKIILDCIQALCSFRDYPKEESENLAIDALICSHHPLVKTLNKHAWVRLVRHLRLDPRELVATYVNNLKNKYIEGYVHNEVNSNIVTTLCQWSEDDIADAGIERALAIFRDPAVLRVTRDEYFAFLTPPGHLYDKSVIPGNEEREKEMNLKRESKAYSYKEQLEELQLRREFEEKNRREGKVTEVPLTAKQKEAVKAQLAKESIIRDRLTVLNARVTGAMELVWAVQRGGAGGEGARCCPRTTCSPTASRAPRSDS